MYKIANNVSVSRLSNILKCLGSVEVIQDAKATTQFLDTFDWRLFNAGLSISVRPGLRGYEILLQDNSKGYSVATIPGDLKTGFAKDFPEGRPRDLIAGIIDVRRLLPHLLIRSNLARLTVRDKEKKAIFRLAIEKSQARRPQGGRAVALGTFISLEPVRGYTEAAARAQAMLEKAIMLLPLDRPVQFDGYESLGINPGDYTSKLWLHLDPSMTALDAVRQVHLTLLDTLERNEDGTADNVDPEFLHDFRVAIRRTRSALTQLDKSVLPSGVIAAAKKDFRWVGQQTNQMRDLDVYLIDYPDLQAQLPEIYKGYLQPFRDYVKAKSIREAKLVEKMVRGVRYRKIRDRWRAYFNKGFASHRPAPLADTPVKELADARIWKAYRKVIKEGSVIDDDSPASDLHELRITCKKLRYLLEFFESLYPLKEVSGLIKALKGLQNVLGEFQDTEIQSQAIIDFGKEMAAANAAPVETQMAMGMVAESILKRQRAARAAFQENFDTFAQEAVIKSFTDLFKNKE